MMRFKKNGSGLFLPLFALFALGCPVSSGAANAALKKTYDSLVRVISARYAVDPQLVHSIIAAESDYDRFAVSAKGAQGLMQLMPETVQDYGVKNVLDPAANIEGGVKYLKDLIKLYGNRLNLVLAAYNAGRSAVTQHKGVPPFPETQDYVTRVQAFYDRERSVNRTTIISFRDASGRLIVTNDSRLMAARRD